MPVLCCTIKIRVPFNLWRVGIVFSPATHTGNADMVVTGTCWKVRGTEVKLYDGVWHSISSYKYTALI